MTAWHALEREAVARELGVGLSGLDGREARARLERFGPNRLEPPPPPSRARILLRQFQSPIIYVLVAAAAVALALGEGTDSAFIGLVLVVNAAIGFANEYRAERQVHALHALVRTRARVHRGGRVLDVDGEEVVPGDLLVLEPGSRVCADVRLVEAHGLRVDESLLTGESVPVEKSATAVLPPEAPLAERLDLAFGGSMVASGRGLGLVVATGAATEVGAIAGELSQVRREPPPLMRRMERFAQALGVAAIGLSALLVTIGVLRGEAIEEVLLGAIALAVSAIPEGLPISLTVALAVAVSRMARRRVVVRHMPAVEALGSCGVVATDKTGTLTCNELTVERVATGTRSYRLSGLGYPPEGEILHDGKPVLLAEHRRLFRLLRAGCLANEANLYRVEEGAETEGAEGEWAWSGDPTDVALLSAGFKAGLDPVALAEAHGLRAAIPFEAEIRYAASYHDRDGGGLVCAKGAPERVLALCTHELDEESGERVPLDAARVLEAAHGLMESGYRVLAVADAETGPLPRADGRAPEPEGLVLLGLVAMTDPPREGVEEAVASCHRAGIRVVMVTGDHATTAASIAARIGLAPPGSDVVTGDELQALDDAALGRRMERCRVVARATPADKLRVVRAFQAAGHYVAVTGDGVNDAPALRQAHLGVAMGRSGTDVAREAADLVITDDRFNSIVAGVEEGRFAYDNVRKVTYLLVSTGLGEVVLVTSAIVLGYPIPLTAVQLLWLNLVTNGIQDKFLAFEPGEPGTLERPPRPPGQRLFDRLMIERTAVAGGVFGVVGLVAWAWLMETGAAVTEARNLLVELFVLFEVFHIGNCRSETRSLLRVSPFHNPLLLFGSLLAFAVHLGAIHTPGLSGVLELAPLAAREWAVLAALAATVLVAMELHKAWRRAHPLP